MNDTESWISWFAPGRATGQTASAAEVGGKGANLVTAYEAGLPVPPGFCLRTSVYREVTGDVREKIIEAIRVGDTAQARALVAGVAVPEKVSEAIRDAYRALGAGPVAVRSSATAEDLDDASFAGQQDTVLGVTGEERLLDAIKQCWASLWTERAVTYRDEFGFLHDDAELAIVVQQMVDADVAGVLFTIDPVSHDPDRMLVSASYGLGESVVAGLVTPDIDTIDASGQIVERQVGSKETRIDRLPHGGTATTPVAPRERGLSSLSPEGLRRLAQLGREVAEHYGGPQDVEWAIVGDHLHLLQARPITTRSATASGHGPARGRIVRLMRDDLIEHYPAPYPLDLMAVKQVQGQIQKVLEGLGIQTPSVANVIRVDDDGVAGIHASLPRPTISVLWRLPGTLWKGLAAPPLVWSEAEERWRTKLAAIEHRSVALEGLSDQELLTLADDAVARAAELTRWRFETCLIPFMLQRAVADLLIRAAGPAEPATTEDLFTELDYVTVVVDREIGQLRSSALRHGLRAELTESDTPMEALRRTPSGRAFLEEFGLALSRIGARTSRMYLPFSNRSWREDPSPLLRIIGAGLDSRDSAAPRAARDGRAVVREALPRVLRPRWDRTVERLRELHLGREATLYVIEEFFVQARRAMDEIGARLAGRGVVNNAADIVFLTAEEMRGVLLGDSGPAILKTTVARRRRHRGRAEASWWDRGTTAEGGAVMTGVAASPGRAVGTARLVAGPENFSDLRPGEVLVCRFTDPTWTPLFALSAAVVAETGGPLSHAAIVAREYGIPAVLGVPEAMQVLDSGRQVLVDGTAGTVGLVEDRD